MEYELIDEKAERQRILRDRARDFERMAVFAHLDSEQFTRAIRLSPDNPTSRSRAQDTKRNAEAQRRIADNAHELADTSGMEFAADIVREVKSRLQALEQQHLYQSVMLENAEAFAIDEQTTRWAVAEFEAGILAVREWIADIEGAIAEQPAEEAPE